jgi:hypothetical protein
MKTSTAYSQDDLFPLSLQLEKEADTALPFNSGGSYCISLEGIGEYYRKMRMEAHQAKIYHL